MVATLFCLLYSGNKILIVNCYRTQTLGIISVRLTELEFTNTQFLKCKKIKNSLEQENDKDARLIPCGRVTWHLASIRYFLAIWTSRKMFHAVVYEKLLKIKIRIIKRMMRRRKSCWKKVEHRDNNWLMGSYFWSSGKDWSGSWNQYFH